MRARATLFLSGTVVVGKVNYEVHIPDKMKKNAVYHINMLKKWNPPEGACFWMAEDVSFDEEDGIPS